MTLRSRPPRDPAKVEFRYSRFGKPSLQQGGIHFNVAHSEAEALIAAAPFPVGIDIEYRRDIEFDLLAQNVFSAEELAAWAAHSAPNQAAAFYRLWTRKEALLKGIGCGIADHVRNVSVFFDDESPVLFAKGVELSPAGEAWQVRSLPAADGFAASIAWVNPGATGEDATRVRPL